MAMELKTTGVNGFVKPAELTNMETLLNAVNDELLTGKGAGSDFLGWLDLPVNYDKEEFARIQKAAKKIQGDSWLSSASAARTSARARPLSSARGRCTTACVKRASPKSTSWATTFLLPISMTW